MVANYFTLLYLTKSLSARLAGLTLRACFSQQRSTLVLQASGPERQEWIEISCESAANYMLPRQSFARARKNSVDVFPELIGKTILEVRLHPSDRQVTILLESKERLLIQLYGASANVFWVSPSHLLRTSFLKPKSLVGTLVLEPEPKPLPVPESFEDLRAFDDGGPIATVVRAALPQLGPLYIREGLSRGGFSGTETMDQLSATRRRGLVEGLRSVFQELLTRPVPRLYEHQDEAPVLSLCVLEHLGDCEVRTLATLEEALALRVAYQFRSQGLQTEKTRLLQQIDRVTRRMERSLAKMAEETSKASRADQYERFGSLVMANLGALTKGMPTLECEDMFDPTRPALRIPLERALSPSQNAQRYFTKAKKARTALSDTALRRAELEKELLQAQGLRLAFEGAESREDLKSCVADHRSQLKKLGISPLSGSGEEDRVPFRVFVVAGGFTVWAGKSSENNDLLTMKHARPNDLWFHARGSGGSHVVLRFGTGKGEISKRAIEESASIAAYYSKMKNASTVPVAMTQRKYIRKPKGAPPGTVIVEREKVLFVEPRLPERASPDRED